MRVDPFVKAHMDEFKRAASKKIAELQAENKALQDANQTLKVAVPALHRRYQEANTKVAQLEKVLETYAREVNRLRGEVREKDSECQLLKLHLQRGTCTSANNAFGHGF